MAKVLSVLLGDLPVGRLTLGDNDGSDFRLLDSYKQAYPRPVLGQIFLDDPDKVWSTRGRVPAWFSNLLPEGPLRELIAEQAGIPAAREFFLLHHLGEDLPGGIRIIQDIADIESSGKLNEFEEYIEIKDSDSWHFSLAGVQLKFSARRSTRGLTIPVTGRGGDWIIKLPDARFREVPQTEYATMRWAEASGISIPEIELISIDDITGLPQSYSKFSEKMSLAVRRFDRPSPDTRIHMEDFAQIFNIYPEEKYKKYNYENLGKLINILGQPGDLAEYVRRLVFIIASGNGDMHHKNWSMIYPDGLNAKLSPAYDLVSTIQYQQDDNLALNINKSKRWEDVDLDTFRRMARKIGVEEFLMTSWADEARSTIVDTWRKNRNYFGYNAESQERIERHIRRIPLFRS